jgi:hypothetical protein
MFSISSLLYDNDTEMKKQLLHSSSLPHPRKIIADAIQAADKSYFFEDYNKQAFQVLQALTQAGYALVPKTPSDAMIEAGVQAVRSGKIRPQDHVRYVYIDMVDQGKNS